MLASSKVQPGRGSARAPANTPFDTYVVELVARHHEKDDQGQQLKRVFESPLGARVHEATLFPGHIHYTFDVPASDMEKTLRSLRSLIPHATITQIYPREFAYPQRRNK